MASARDILQTLAQEYAVAWSSGDPNAVAGFFAETGQITINRGDPIRGREAIAQMASEFFASFPGLEIHCDLMRRADSHALFAWTLEGQHVDTGNKVVIGGWEEWELDAENRVISSFGWFDVEDYQRQIDGR